MNKIINEHASELGKLNKGKKKNFSPEELKKRADRMREIGRVRNEKVKEAMEKFNKE